MTELTFAILKFGFLAALWVFVGLAVRSLHRDVNGLAPRPSRKRRHKAKAAAQAAQAAVEPVAPARPPNVPTPPAPAHAAAPTLLVIIDGPLAGSTVPLTGEPITLGRSAGNTLVIDDEFVSSHHARVIQDPASGQWAIEDLGSTNGTLVEGRRISAPTILPARVPVRIGATTFELR